MAARAMWKGVLRFGEARVPVKLYAAAADHSVHFRLLHQKDRVPVRQAMVEPDSDRVVEYQDARRAYVGEDQNMVVLDRSELESVEPKPSRDIDVLHFLPASAIDHRWYLRPYYLGPDGSAKAYACLAAALKKTGRVGFARWVMRKKGYQGALILHRDYPMLVSLRHAEEVVPVADLTPPGGRALDKRELDMARQLIGMLEALFVPEDYHDTYRERVLDLIETKRRGGSAKVVAMKRRRPSEDLGKALEASLKQERKRA